MGEDPRLPEDPAGDFPPTEHAADRPALRIDPVPAAPTADPPEPGQPPAPDGIVWHTGPLRHVRAENSPETPAAFFREPPGRVVVVEHLYRQFGSEEPVSASGSYCSPVFLDEQVYERRLKVGAAWQRLADGCWVSRASLLILTGPDRPWLLELALLPPVETSRTMFSPPPPEPVIVARVLAGESLRMRPAALESLLVRCPAVPEPVRCGLVVFPD